MNATALHPYTPVITTSPSSSRDSLLEKIFSRLVQSLKSYRTPGKSTVVHVGFIESNLLDRNLGPEISRALR